MDIDTSSLLKSLVSGTSASNTLPDPSGDFQFYASFPSFNGPVCNIKSKLEDLIKQVVVKVGGKTGHVSDISDFDELTVVLDNLMEKADYFLDSTDASKSNIQSTLNKASLITVDGGDVEMSKPQLYFPSPVDNSVSFPLACNVHIYAILS